MLTIPDKILVGYQQRSDTFTGRLAYVTHIDNKGNIRKEKSWRQWTGEHRDVSHLELSNKAAMGFIVNKGIKRDGSFSSSSGRNVVRVYHPLDFEFEIDMDNLTSILMHANVSKREIMEKCVMAWDGVKLVLVCVNSQEYKEALEEQKVRSTFAPVSKKTLAVGARVVNKHDCVATYIGEYDWWDWECSSVTGSPTDYRFSNKNLGRQKVFFNHDTQEFELMKMTGFSTDGTQCELLDDLVQQYAQSIHFQAVAGLEVAEFNIDESIESEDDVTDNLNHINLFSIDGDSLKCYLLSNDLFWEKREFAVYTNGSAAAYTDEAGENFEVYRKQKFNRALNSQSLVCKKTNKVTPNSFFRKLYKDKEIGQIIFIMKDGQEVQMQREFFPGF